MNMTIQEKIKNLEDKVNKDVILQWQESQYGVLDIEVSEGNLTRILNDVVDILKDIKRDLVRLDNQS